MKPKTILITGSTDGIGLETARMLAADGHQVLLHGRNPDKLKAAAQELSAETFRADLSSLAETKSLAAAVAAKHPHLDVLINNAGVFLKSETKTPEGLGLTFAVNTIAPYLLTKSLLPLFNSSGRIINLSSAAQTSVDLSCLTADHLISGNEAYAQSKLALTMWSKYLADQLAESGPLVIAVNPKSFLGTKMVKEAYGMAGSDLSEGARILVRAALSDEFANANGLYFDNDHGAFASPHPDAKNPTLNAELVTAIEELLPSS
ncbi:MAG: SDR family NAD(P)-dependent oxidoreductase [Verrucomicrobiota bacterium]